MTNQEKKAALSRYLNVQKEIWVKLQEIEQLKSLAEKVTPIYSFTPNGTSDGNRIEASIEKIEKVEKEVAEKINLLIEERKKIYDMVSSIQNPTYREVLIQRYILGKTWERIAVDMCYSYMQIYRIHGKAIQELKML